MTEQKDIWNEEHALKDDALLRYLEGRATDEERFAIEDQMADSEFLNDAVEGLQGFQDQEQLKQYVAQLNLQLRNQTNRKKRKGRRKMGSQQWALIALVAILLLSVLGYYIIRLFSTPVAPIAP